MLTDPYAIFAQTKAHLEAAHYPAQIAYGVVVSVSLRGKTSSAHYHLYYDSTRGAVRVIGVSDEELKHPYTPHGINTYLDLFGSSGDKGIPLSAPQRTYDFLGVPILAPNYTFGIARYAAHAPTYDDPALVREIRREFGEAPKKPVPSGPASGLRTIASVRAGERDYVMRLAGIDAVNGHRDYHLTLNPLRDPDRFRLREMWVNTATFALDRVATQGNFVFGGAAGVRWTTSFQNVGGATYLESERTSQGFSELRHSYDSASVTFADIRVEKIPAYAWISRFATNAETGMPPLVEPAF